MKIVLDKQFYFNSSSAYLNPKRMELDDFYLNFKGAFELQFKNEVFNGYSHSNGSEILCVFLSAAGRHNVKTRGEVVFAFTNFIGAINANMLYIEDPMYQKHLNLDCGWFYGDQYSSHIDQVVEIVKSIANKNKIEYKNIVFIGVSSGGYAAISCADKFKGTKAYAFNPQIKLNDWWYSKRFAEITGLDTSEQDSLCRNDISRFIENKESKFFIHFNTFSDLDQPQAKVICDALGIEIKDGLVIKDNVFVSLKSMNVSVPHNSRFEAADLSIAICMMDGFENNMHEIFKAYLNKMYSVARLQDKRSVASTFLDFLMTDKPCILSKAKKVADNYLDYSVDDGYGLFFYRVLYNFDIGNFQLIFYVNESKHTFLDGYISDLSKKASANDCVFLLVRDRKFMRICKTLQPGEDINKAFMDFFDNTYAFALQRLERAIAEEVDTLPPPSNESKI